MLNYYDDYDYDSYIYIDGHRYYCGNGKYNDEFMMGDYYESDSYDDLDGVYYATYYDERDYDA